MACASIAIGSLVVSSPPRHRPPSGRGWHAPDCVDQTAFLSALDDRDIAYMALSLVGALQFLWSLGRKAWLNSFSTYELPPANLSRIG